MPRSVTIRQLARQIGKDPDDILLVLWDYESFDYLKGHNDRIRAKQIPKVRELLNLENPNKYTHVTYWMNRLQLTRDEFSSLLNEMGISLSREARRLPKGALRRLHRHYPKDQEAKSISSNKKPERSEQDSVDTPPSPPFRWYTVGPEQGVSYLDEDTVIRIHGALVADFAKSKDPISPPGVRDRNLLSSAVARPQTGLGEILKYPSVELAGAALMYAIVLNHAFFNGNKRTALVSLLVFLDSNSYMPTCSEDDLFKITLQVAQHKLVPDTWDNLPDREVQNLAQWIRKNSRRISSDDRPITWLKLKRILRHFGCEYDMATGVGNRINIRRRIPRAGRRLFPGARRRSRQTQVQVQYGGDGTEVAAKTIRLVRSKLLLSEEFGVDSTTFYSAGNVPDEFVQTYRKTLRRLARQ